MLFVKFKMKFIWIIFAFFPALHYPFVISQTVSNSYMDFAYPNCTITAEDSGVRDKIKLLLEDGKKIIFIHLSFPNQNMMFFDKYAGPMYKPMDWVRTVGRHGRSLLFLRPQFEQLSMTTLSFETGYIEVALTQFPDGCTSFFNSTTMEKNLRKLLLSDFNTGDDGSLSEHEHICNMHIRNDHSYASFFYQCCHRDPGGNIVCQDMFHDFWIDVVFVCVFIINFLTLMFSPYLIPTSLYREKYATNVYEHKLMKAFNFRVVKTDKVPRTEDERNKVVPIGNLRQTPQFYQFVQNLNLNQTAEVTTNKINITVQYRRLLPANYVPVGITKTFYNMLVKCHIRKVPSFSKCCRGSILGNFFNREKSAARRSTYDAGEYANDSATKSNDNLKNMLDAKYPWHRYLRMCMRFLMLIAVAFPWIIRVFFFFKYEKPHATERQNAAAKRNLTLPFQWNLTNTFTPVHYLFLLCYSIFVFDVMTLGIVSHDIKVKLQYLMRKCLRDMRDISRSKALEWSALTVLIPCEKFGIFGFFIFAIYIVFALPVILAVLAFYCLPTVNLTLRLMAHFIAYLMPHYGQACCRRSVCIQCKNFFRALYDHFHMEILSEKESLERPDRISIKNRFLQLFVLLACLVTVFSFALIAMEIIVFFVEVFVYTIIGIIMNASSMLKYISLIFMLGLYARDCFKGISDKYMEFNKSINRIIVDMMRDKVEVIASSDVQKNTAFQVETEPADNITDKTEKDTENVELIVKDGIPKWHIWRLILFLDINDKPYLAEKFFFRTCYMDTVGVPGPLIPNLVRATWRFLCICVFLMFVVLIVLAFGDEYQISGTNQMLATLAGGFLPWVFRNVLFKSKDALALDSKNLSFKSNFKNEIDKFEQTWEISDIEINENNQVIQRSTVANQDDNHHDKFELKEMEDDSDKTCLMVSEREETERRRHPTDVHLIVFDDKIRETNII